jgi:phenylalanyl-tRNA synthetase beta chain
MVLKAAIRNVLSRAGANELLTYSFVHGKLLQNAGQDPEQAFKLSNALSPDLQYYRLSVTPSLLDKVHANIKSGHDSFALFELGKAHNKATFDDDGLPSEFNRIALTFAANAKAAQAHAGAPYYQARHLLTYLLDELHAIDAITMTPFDATVLKGHPAVEQMVAPFEPDRTAIVHDGERVVGVVGEYKNTVCKAYKLPEYSAGFEIFHRFLLQPQSANYVPLSKYPKIEQDVCYKVVATVPYQSLIDLVTAEIARVAADDTYSTVSPVDIYQRPDDTAHKQITLRLSITSYDKTLRDSEVSGLLDEVTKAAQAQLQAERI